MGDKILLHFKQEVTGNAIGSVEFAHKGYVFTAKVEITGSNDITDISLVGNEAWALGSSDYTFDLESGNFTTTATPANAIELENLVEEGGVATARSWFPATETELPALKLSVNGTVETADAKPARTPNAGQAYYLYAKYDGADLVFDDKGTKENPFTVAEAFGAQGRSDVWVKGYIVGWQKGVGSYEFSTTDGSYGSTTNIIIADNPEEKNGNNVIPVQLKTAAGSLNLKDNPGMYKKQVLLKGDLEDYFSQAGLKEVTDYTIPPAGPFFEADKETVVFGSSLELTETIAISTNDTQAWTATSDEAWLTVAPASGTGSGDVTITATENTDTEAGRTATVTLTPIDNAELSPIVVTVTQAAFEATIVVDPASLAFAKEGGSETIAVTANVSWTASSDAAGWLTLTPSEDMLKVDATANEGEARTANITITGNSVTKIIAVTQAAEGSGDLLFPGSDFNDWSAFTGALSTHGLKDYATESTTGGRGGSGALHIKGTPTGNDYVFTAVVPEGFSATGKTMIHFWVKGTAAKSLSLNVYTGSSYKPYNLGSATADVVLEPAASNQYTGTVNTGEEWIKVSLDISTLALSSTPGQNLFALKIGKDADYDLYVDDITIE